MCVEIGDTIRCYDLDDLINTMIESDNYVIIDEYDEVISFNDFIKMVEDKQSVENPDNFTYDKNVNGYRFTDGEFS